jgi:hypothetical protein
MKRLIIVAGTTAALAIGGGAAAYASSSSSSPGSPPVSPPVSPPKATVAGPDLGNPLYGEATVKDSSGAITVRDWQKGTVTAVSGSSLTVRSSDGTTWTWTANGDSKVGDLVPFGSDDSAKTSLSAIKTGDSVLIAGVRSGSTRTAQRIADPPPDFGKIKQRLDDLRKKIEGDLRNGLPKGLPSPGN